MSYDVCSVYVRCVWGSFGITELSSFVVGCYTTVHLSFVLLLRECLLRLTPLVRLPSLLTMTLEQLVYVF